MSPPAELPQFDVITLGDTIEHLDRPNLALDQIYDLLHCRSVLAERASGWPPDDIASVGPAICRSCKRLA